MSNRVINQEFWNQIGALPASSVCGFVNVPKLRNALLETGDRFTVSDFANSGDEGQGKFELASIAKSKYERSALQRGFSDFILAAVDSQQPGRSTSEKLTWVVSEDRLTRQLELDFRTIQTIEEHQLTSDLGYEYQKWLPWLSLGMVNLLRRWRRPRVSALHRALFKLFEKAEFDLPWDTKFLSWRHQLPIKVLYRHEPSELVNEVLITLSNWGLKSVNELRFLHLDAVAASKAKSQPLISLYRILEAEDA